MSRINESSVLSAWRLLFTVRAGLICLFHGVLERWRHRQTLTTLSRLDRRQLEDIGMSRNDILRISAGKLSSRSYRMNDPWGRLCHVIPKARGFQ
jgi:uncharacterized protein YjiS (DUF1127 family)